MQCRFGGQDHLSGVASCFIGSPRRSSGNIASAPCRDFRASPTSNFEMDTADKDRPIAMPTLILWGAREQPAERTREFADVWRKYARNVVDADAMPCGHYIQEEMPDHVYERFIEFFTV
jgi:haloacetate dehalogenase